MNKVTMALMLAPLLIFAAGPAAAEPERCHTVRMAEPGWTDLALTTGIASVLLKSLGYNATSAVLGIPVIYQSMENEELDVFLGYWDPAMEVYYKDFRDRGTVETVHQNLEGAKFTFAVPRYVHAAGVRSFSDLAAHAEAFDRKLYGIEPGSNEIMLKIVETNAFGLGDWKVVESSEQAMLAQVQRAAKSKDWIVFLGWAPHPMNNRIEMEYLAGGDDFYGPNFGGATVHTQVRKDYMAECPNVARMLTNLTFDIPMESEGMDYILNEGLGPEDAARKVIASRPERLEAWLDGVTTVDGGDGLQAVRQSLNLD